MKENGGNVQSDVQFSSVTGEGLAENADGKMHQNLLALSRVSAAVSGLWDLDVILEITLDNVLTIMDGAIGGILLLDAETQTLSYRVYRGLSAEIAEVTRLKVGEGIAGAVAQSGRSVLLEDVSLDPRVVYPELVRKEGLKAFIGVPLRSKEVVLGVIIVASLMAHKFSKDDMHLLHSIGNQVGLAIEQAKLHERLEKGRERYRQLARQTLMVQEEARRKIAQELHDETTQTLYGLALNLQALVDMAEMSNTHDEEFRVKLKKTHSLAIDISVKVDRLIRELRPPLLDTLGLVPALRQYAEATLGPLGIRVSLETKGNVGPLPPEVDAGLFRFAQGAVSNIARHSQAKNVTISLERKANELFVRISDDGKGFDVSKITGIDESGRGRGLFSMKERVGLLGGRCSVKSQAGEGTIVTARVPLIPSMDDVAVQ